MSTPAVSYIRVLMVVFWIHARVFAANSPCPGNDLFQDRKVHQLTIEISSEGIESLRSYPRIPVQVSVRETGCVYSNVSLHLKGATGSFRPIDNKPGLTLDFDKLQQGQRFHGLRKIHLNNSVEDPSYLNELIGNEFFSRLGIPTPRVSHARVALNSRNLGLFVLKEGYTEDFLHSWFSKIGDGLYEPEDGYEIARMQRNSIQNAQHCARTKLRDLAAACQDPDLHRRWSRLTNALNADQFATFMAAEVVLCHSDGYSVSRNNFRLYEDVITGKLVFLPHGMDQLFARPDFPWEPAMAGTVAKAFMETEPGRKLYQSRFQAILTNQFRTETLTNQIDKIVTHLRPQLEASEYQTVRSESDQINARIVSRIHDLHRQLIERAPPLLSFSNGVAQLTNWKPFDVPEGGKMDQSPAQNGTVALHILAGPATMASWRTKTLLPQGRYRFEAKVRLSGFKPLPYGTHQGTALRVSGTERDGNELAADAPGKILCTEFSVTKQTEEVELICEFRASGGQAWFESNSLILKRYD